MEETEIRTEVKQEARTNMESALNFSKLDESVLTERNKNPLKFETS
jgi:hypothetical protein